MNPRVLPTVTGPAPTWLLVVVSFLALQWLLLEGFVFDPNDLSREHWQQQIGNGVGLLLLTAPVPAAAVVSAVLAWSASARTEKATVSAAFAIICAVLLAVAIVCVSVDNIGDARRHAGLL
jgi:Kef-type K+ transport system membrane component KefB